MSPVLLFLCMSFFILVSNLSHARGTPHLSPASLPPNSQVMQPIVQYENARFETELVLAIIFASIAIILVIISAFCACFIWRKNGSVSGQRNAQISDTNGRLTLSPVLNRFNPLSITGSIPEVEYSLIESATNNFSERNIWHKGQYAVFYKAHFSFGCVAAVKRFNDKDPCSEKVFESELVLLSNIKHPNIVSLLGYCFHGEMRLLVYESMQYGSLETQLHGLSNGSSLTWHIRMKIALDAARGLEYLHEHCNPPVIHRALKSSNILLDSNFNAKISDFGLALACGNQNEHNRLKLSDTKGYLAPEFFLNSELTEKSDVYAFGMVLLELLMGRKFDERMMGPRYQSAITWTMPQLINREKLPEITDPAIRHSTDLNHLCQVAAVALLCVQHEPSYRPLITDVVYSLIPLVPLELGGTSKVSGPQF